jgi:hypothetical protein
MSFKVSRFVSQDSAGLQLWKVLYQVETREEAIALRDEYLRTWGDCFILEITEVIQ